MTQLNLTVFSETTQQTFWIRNHVFDDVTITDHVIYSTSSIKSKVNCGKECAKSDICRSFSYNGHDGTCRMHSETFSNSASSLPSSGSRYYTMATDHCPTEDGYVLLEDVKLCFKVFNLNKKQMAEARDVCNQSRSRLIVLDTKEKNLAVSDYIKENIGNSKFFIGLTDEDHEDIFVWENGKTANFTNWNTREPNNLNNENCVLLITNTGKWNDMG
ncbi:macrophage mannose receptor 1-like [Gigantopelta aegis]|uniref:macrophage mannose receptor 1-like n=1 Tax=Gigantopelta aegis TaxID=1735272 RepID=UPI001B8887AC|nr:macrophage mannose receptor 1-like [Gigantopelta aegis]